MDVLKHNRDAWDEAVSQGDQWTVPVTPEAIEAAKQGAISIVLTPIKPIPMDWFPELRGCDVLGLASAGGQQCPILAAAGANVTVFDNSPKQLAQDRLVAEREGLSMSFVQGDMADLSCFEDASFDLIVHPVSNCFVPDVHVVWKEAYRVLRPGGRLLAGFNNPILYAFDEEFADKGVFLVRYPLPFSDLENPLLSQRVAEKEPLEFGHLLEDQIGGQLRAGFVLTGMYEDTWGPDRPLSHYLPAFMATCARKPPVG